MFFNVSCAYRPLTCLYKMYKWVFLTAYLHIEIRSFHFIKMFELMYIQCASSLPAYFE